ncbi:hypothetical protein Z949_3411 [Sulfitobacter guttiformis KCTC 32187]|nr:hypothetical protein Z949_3411 [Sulfitobacter guttiformis KCTC 32187]
MRGPTLRRSSRELRLRWFRRLDLEGAVSEPSAFNKNRHRRVTDDDPMRRAFDPVVGVCADNGMIAAL